jgi:hypothetical protein
MFGRGILFIVVVLVAIFAPYYLSERPDATSSAPDQRGLVGRWWDSMWTDSIDGRSPVASTSPIPRAGQRSANQSTYRNYAAYPPQNTGHASLPHGYSGVPMATPWVPVGSPQTGPSVSGLPTSWTGGTATRTPGVPAQDLRQLIRFDRTPEWIVHNWTRVSTEVWDGDLAGMRVPLISGTAAYDLAGSLTYYFDQQQVLQRIAFQGTTGDASYIKALVTQLGLQPKPTYGGTTLVRQSGDVVSDMLRVRPLPGQASPIQRFDLIFELNRPGNNRSVSQACDNLLKSCSSLPSLEMPKLPTPILPRESASP